MIVALAVAQRVVDQVAERLAEPQLVGLAARRPVRRLDADRAPALGGAVGEARAHPLEQLARLERLAGARGSAPSPARASTSRSSASCARWSHSSTAADERLAHLADRRPPARSAPSSSALITAIGVRSSWLASATKRRSRS